MARSVALALAAGAGGGTQAQPSGTAEQRFADAFVTAIRSGEVTRLRALVHPATLVCEDGPAGDYVHAMYSTVLHDGARFGPAFKIHQITPMDAATSTAGDFPFPAPPSFRMQIDSETAGRPMAMNVWIAPAGGGWLAVYPCPTAAGMKIFRQNTAR